MLHHPVNNQTLEKIRQKNPKETYQDLDPLLVHQLLDLIDLAHLLVNLQLVIDLHPLGLPNLVAMKKGVLHHLQFLRDVPNHELQSKALLTQPRQLQLIQLLQAEVALSRLLL